MRLKVEVTIHEKQVDDPDAVTKVTVTHDKCKAVRTVGRGIDWMVDWNRPDPVPRLDGMTPEQRDVVSEAMATGIQLLGPRGGFTPRTELSVPGEAHFD